MKMRTSLAAVTFLAGIAFALPAAAMGDGAMSGNPSSSGAMNSPAASSGGMMSSDHMGTMSTGKPKHHKKHSAHAMAGGAMSNGTMSNGAMSNGTMSSGQSHDAMGSSGKPN